MLSAAVAQHAVHWSDFTRTEVFFYVMAGSKQTAARSIIRRHNGTPQNAIMFVKVHEH